MKINQARNLIITTFKKFKLSGEHAKICADALINAELVGAPSHGFARVTSYCNRNLSMVAFTSNNNNSS